MNNLSDVVAVLVDVFARFPHELEELFVVRFVEHNLAREIWIKAKVLYTTHAAPGTRAANHPPVRFADFEWAGNLAYNLLSVALEKQKYRSPKSVSTNIFASSTVAVMDLYASSGLVGHILSVARLLTTGWLPVPMLTMMQNTKEQS